jgi:HEAT repeat protein
MELRRLFLHGMSPNRTRIIYLGLCVVLLIIVCTVLFYWERQKGIKSDSAVLPEKKTAQMASKSPKKQAKQRKAGKVTISETAVARGQYAGKGMPEDASSKEKSRTIAEETPKVLDPAESVIRTDLSEEERRAAVKALANMDHATILEVVMKALDSPSPDVRKAVLEALAEVDDEAVNVPLLKAMEDENVEVREEAMQVMDELESPNILPSLELALFDSDEDIREEALSILEDIPNHGAVDILIEKGLQHEDESIREDTLDSLDYLTDQRFASYEEAHEWWEANRDEFVFEEPTKQSASGSGGTFGAAIQ